MQCNAMCVLTQRERHLQTKLTVSALREQRAQRAGLVLAQSLKTDRPSDTQQAAGLQELDLDWQLALQRSQLASKLGKPPAEVRRPACAPEQACCAVV